MIYTAILDNYIYTNIMRVSSLDLNFSYNDPQPRDGGAPNPRTESPSLALLSMAGDKDPQPRDGG